MYKCKIAMHKQTDSQKFKPSLGLTILFFSFIYTCLYYHFHHTIQIIIQQFLIFENQELMPVINISLHVFQANFSKFIVVWLGP